MKRVFLILAVALTTVCSAFSQASDYKAFKVDVGFLYAIPGGDGVKAGAGFYLEPKYNITNSIALGLKYEIAAMAASDDAGMSASVSAVNTFQLTGDYYFNENKVRPFAGLGIGMFNLGSVEYDVIDAAMGNVPDLELGTKFGFTPRVGLLLGHFRAALEYNVITGLEESIDSKNYLSLKLGFEIGGGRK